MSISVFPNDIQSFEEEESQHRYWPCVLKEIVNMDSISKLIGNERSNPCILSKFDSISGWTSN